MTIFIPILCLLLLSVKCSPVVMWLGFMFSVFGSTNSLYAANTVCSVVVAHFVACVLLVLCAFVIARSWSTLPFLQSLSFTGALQSVRLSKYQVATSCLDSVAATTKTISTYQRATGCNFLLPTEFDYNLVLCYTLFSTTKLPIHAQNEQQQ